MARRLNKRNCGRRSVMTERSCPPKGDLSPVAPDAWTRPARLLWNGPSLSTGRSDRTLERRTMDYVKPADVVSAMIAAGKAKAALGPRDLLIRGILAGALLGVATSLAFGAALTTGQPIVGALIFPAGFVMICILGLEPVTGSFA